MTWSHQFSRSLGFGRTRASGAGFPGNSGGCRIASKYLRSVSKKNWKDATQQKPYKKWMLQIQLLLLKSGIFWKNTSFYPSDPDESKLYFVNFKPKKTPDLLFVEGVPRFLLRVPSDFFLIHLRDKILGILVPSGKTSGTLGKLLNFQWRQWKTFRELGSPHPRFCGLMTKGHSKKNL